MSFDQRVQLCDHTTIMIQALVLLQRSSFMPLCCSLLPAFWGNKLNFSSCWTPHSTWWQGNHGPRAAVTIHTASDSMDFISHPVRLWLTQFEEREPGLNTISKHSIKKPLPLLAGLRVHNTAGCLNFLNYLYLEKQNTIKGRNCPKI